MRAALVDPAQAGFTATQDPIRGSRRHLEMAGGVPAEWRPSRVVLTEPVREERPTGKRVPPPEVGDPTEMQRQQRVHSDRFNARTTTESEFGGGLRIEKKRVVVDEASGVPRRSKPSGEGALEPTMGRKRHVDPSDLTSLRNGWGVSTLGDKPYASPEYCPDFHKSSATIGAAWGSFKRLPEFKGSGAGGAGPKGPTPLGASVRRSGSGLGEAPPVVLPSSYVKATVEQRRVAELLAQELAEVAKLTPAGDGTSWEERTGFRTV